MADVGWVDWALIAVLAISVLVGLWRGLVFEVMSLLGWVVAYVVAQAFSAQLAPHLPVGTPGGALQAGAAFAVTFVLALIAWMILARLLRLLIQATPLTVIDRMLGAGFGLLRGLVLLLAAATLIAFTPAAASPAWQHSIGAAWLATLLQGLKPVLPEAVARHLRA